MKMFKKVLAVLLAAVMMLAMLTACESTDQGEHVLDVLNQVRTENYGTNALARNDEADAYAQQLADVIRNYYNGSVSEQAMTNKLDEMFGTSVGGHFYRELFITGAASSVSPAEFTGKGIATCDSVYAGVASFSAQGASFTIVIAY